LKLGWPAAAGIAAAVSLVYRGAAASYFFNDDFHWLQRSQHFHWSKLVDLSQYDHFYRPVIEVYFYAGLQLFGCAAAPFHVASIVIHLLCTLILFFFARSLTANVTFAWLSAIFFGVLPGHFEAVAWVGAITDLLPALWYALAMWMHLRYLQERRRGFYLGALTSFVACLLTHESSATLLPMMMALEATVRPEEGIVGRALAVARRGLVKYLPFAVLLVCYLLLAYEVNTRSYLVREGHYAFGWHAIPHVLDYIVTLYIGKRVLPTYVAIVVVVGALLLRGTPRIQFFVIWILVAILPASFFTWGNVSRYLYLPALGFALLLAEFVLAMERLTRARVSVRAARLLTIAAVAVLTVRFAVFAKKGADGFRARTLPYERYVAALRQTNPGATPGSVVYVDTSATKGVPDLYREPAAQVGLCVPDLRVVLK
jgi:hypothetical protein